jgi:hypothetical protein
MIFHYEIQLIPVYSANMAKPHKKLQTEIQKTMYTNMADLGTASHIHPHNKLMLYAEKQLSERVGTLATFSFARCCALGETQLAQNGLLHRAQERQAFGITFSLHWQPICYCHKILFLLHHHPYHTL